MRRGKKLPLARPPWAGPCAGRHTGVVLIVRYGRGASTLCAECTARLVRNGGPG